MQADPQPGAIAGRARTFGEILGQFGSLLRIVRRDVRNIGADGDAVGAEFLYGIVEVIEKGRDITVAAKEARNDADADESVGIADCLDDLVRLGAEMSEEAGAGGVAGDHRTGRGFRGFKASPPSGMGDIDDDADTVHFCDGLSAEIAQASV
jgi:hypothetical protein